MSRGVILNSVKLEELLAIARVIKRNLENMAIST